MNMNTIFKLASTSIILLIISCNHQTKNRATEQTRQEGPAAQDMAMYIGSYVQDDYFKRNEGYDWMAVYVSQLTDSTIHIRVRSRMDKKKPTCTFDAEAIKIADNQFKSMMDGKSVIYTFKNDSINIAPGKDEDISMLQYYCSGGGNFGGSYKKLDEPLDESQIDKRIFTKFLFLQNIGFDINTTANGTNQLLSIQPTGLKIDNREITMDLEGSVVNAEVEDLNSDGFPELLIYTKSSNNGGQSHVIGFSVNNGKSLSSIYFPPISENPQAYDGYHGEDEFSIVETTLVQRFKTYKMEGSILKPTGLYRQIQFKMMDGEAGRKFVIDKTIEFPY